MQGRNSATGNNKEGGGTSARSRGENNEMGGQSQGQGQGGKQENMGQEQGEMEGTQSTQGAQDTEGKRPSQATVQQYLEGISYPANKQDLVEYARQKGAPQEVIQLLEELPDEEYSAPTQVSAHFKER